MAKSGTSMSSGGSPVHQVPETETEWDKGNHSSHIRPLQSKNQRHAPKNVQTGTVRAVYKKEFHTPAIKVLIDRKK